MSLFRGDAVNGSNALIHRPHMEKWLRTRVVVYPGTTVFREIIFHKPLLAQDVLVKRIRFVLDRLHYVHIHSFLNLEPPQFILRVGAALREIENVALIRVGRAHCMRFDWTLEITRGSA